MTLAGTLLAFFGVGIVGGFLLGLIGVGMALVAVPILIMTLPWLGLPADQAPAVALATSMAVVAVGALSSVYSHHRLGNIDWRIVWTTLPASLVGVALGSVVASHLPGQALRWIFAAFLAFIGLRMLLARSLTSSTPAEQIPAWQYRAVGGAIGVAGSLIGAGGNVFMVPFLNARGQAMKSAVATATAIALPVATVGAVVYALQPLTPPHDGMMGLIFLPAFAGIGLGSVMSAPAAARLATKVPAAVLKSGFAILLLVLAAKMMLG